MQLRRSEENQESPESSERTPFLSKEAEPKYISYIFGVFNDSLIFAIQQLLDPGFRWMLGGFADQ